jgi:hypothetical protein
MTLTTEQLDKHTREELLELIKKQLPLVAEVERLQRREVKPDEIRQRQITELPIGKPMVILNVASEE